MSRRKTNGLLRRDIKNGERWWRNHNTNGANHLLSIRRINMLEWTPKELKNYPHFDNYLDINEILKIVKDPRRVAQNPFFPFLQFKKIIKQYRKKGEKKKKERIIRYACRRDSYIYEYYRYKLQPLYEQKLLDYDCHVVNDLLSLGS